MISKGTSQELAEMLAREHFNKVCPWIAYEKPEWPIEKSMTMQAFLQGRASLADELREMREALEFYAANESWCCSADPQFGDSVSVDDYEENSPITKRRFVGGKRAREVLAKYGKG